MKRVWEKVLEWFWEAPKKHQNLPIIMSAIAAAVSVAAAIIVILILLTKRLI